MENIVTLELTKEMIDIIVDCVNDRLEDVEDFIAIEESRGNEADADNLRGVSMELEVLLAHLQN